MATTSRMSMVSFISLLEHEAARESWEIFAPTDVGALRIVAVPAPVFISKSSMYLFPYSSPSAASASPDRSADSRASCSSSARRGHQGTRQPLLDVAGLL